MKKTKLLTSLAALALVLSLAACEVNVDVGGVDVDVDIDSDETSEPDEDEDDDDGNTDDTGEGGESGDGSGSGDGSTPEDPSGNPNPEPGQGEGGEQDPNLASAQAILDAAAATQYLEWDGVHAKEYEDDELSAEIYLALDSSSKAYGYWYTYDDGDPDTYNYYVEGTKYIYDPYEDEGEQYTSTTTGANIDLETFLDDYSEALEEAGDIDLTDENTSYTLSEQATKLEVEITSTNVYGLELTTTYTYVVDADLNLVGVGLYEPDILGLSYSGYFAEVTTYEEVASVMASEFDITNWVPDVSYTYAIEVVNEDFYKTLEYNANGDNMISTLGIYLITYADGQEILREYATSEDVTLTGYDENVISLNGFTLTPTGEGETEIIITWKEYATYTLSIVVIDVTPSQEGDLDLVTEILTAINENDIEWEGIHGDYYSEDEEGDIEQTTTDIFVNESDVTLGRTKDEEYYLDDEETWLYEEFYQDGVVYFHENYYDDDEDEYYDEYYFEEEDGPSIEEALSDYSTAIDEIDRLLEEIDGAEFSLTSSSGTYKLVITLSSYGTETYTYITDSEYTLTEFGYERIFPDESIETEYAKEITLDDVKEIMDSEFDIDLWGDLDDDEDIELASEIIESILDNDVDWDAYHGELDEEGEYDVVDFALDDNSNTYGRRLSYEDEELYEEVFYQDGTAYWHDLAEDDPDDAYYTSTTVPSISNYFESNFADALDEAEDIDFDDDYTLDTLEYLANGGYKIVVGYSYTNFNSQTVTGTFTYVVDSSYRLTELGYEFNAVNGTTTEYAKEITLDDVKEIMNSEFDISLWLEEEEDETLVGTLTFLSSNTAASTTAFSTDTLQTCLTAAYSGTETITAGDTNHTYPGSNGTGNGLKGDADCIQLGGSGSNAGAFAFTLSGTDSIVKLVVKVVYYDSVKNMTINENATSISYNCTDFSSWDDVPEVEYTLEATTSFEISVSAGANRMLVHSIELYSA